MTSNFYFLQISCDTTTFVFNFNLLGFQGHDTIPLPSSHDQFFPFLHLFRLLGFIVVSIMGKSKTSPVDNSSGLSLPKSGCNQPMKMWVSNTIDNPNRKLWKC